MITLASAIVSPDNSCGGSKGYTCPSGKCCSQYGWCGSTSSYCGTGCQSAFGICGTIITSSTAPVPNPTALPISPDNSCGSDVGYRCSANACCSQYGWCGTTSGHCGTGCQNAFGPCGTLPPVTTTTQPPIPSGTIFPESPDNRCGLAAGFSCPNSCCSQYNWCGSTGDYCGTGCQSAFGQCGTITLSSSPTPTVIPGLPITTNGDCGPEVRKRCPLTGNVCCADNGVCGNTVEHCGIVRWVCQPGYGQCGGPQPNPPSNSYPPLDASKKTAMVTKCNRPGVFALTFDDGVFDYTDALLDVLTSNNVKATFFINAYNWGDVSKNPYRAALLKMFAGGHHIASHTYDHLDLARLDHNGIYAQMQRNDAVIASIIGKRPIYMRPPYGSVNDPVLIALGSWGYKVIWQNIDSEDVFHLGNPNANTLNKQAYTAVLSQSSFTRDSFISLQHDTIEQTAVEWTQTAINYVRSLNYTLVTVGDCLGESSSTSWYRV
jgi:peptidoglycan/xylan/chitin deacetylase (PgdA/CDA1 family)